MKNLSSSCSSYPASHANSLAVFFQTFLSSATAKLCLFRDFLFLRMYIWPTHYHLQNWYIVQQIHTAFYHYHQILMNIKLNVYIQPMFLVILKKL